MKYTEESDRELIIQLDERVARLEKYLLSLAEDSGVIPPPLDEIIADLDIA